MRYRRTKPAAPKDTFMAHVISAPHSNITLIQRVRDLISKAQAARARRIAYETSYAALQNITSSELREFGLYRSDLPALAREAVK
jgi:hypothetical protein